MSITEVRDLNKAAAKNAPKLRFELCFILRKFMYSTQGK